MRKLTVEKMRQIMEDIWGEFEKTDEELLELNLYSDCTFDSLDFQDLCNAVEVECCINIDNQSLRKASFYKNPTIGNFIRICNEKAAL